MTKQFAYLKQRDTVHYEPTGEGMTKVMNVKVFDLSAPTGGCERTSDILNPIPCGRLLPELSEMM
jgi:hypothetical protein